MRCRFVDRYWRLFFRCSSQRQASSNNVSIFLCLLIWCFLRQNITSMILGFCWIYWNCLKQLSSRNIFRAKRHSEIFNFVNALLSHFENTLQHLVGLIHRLGHRYVYLWPNHAPRLPHVSVSMHVNLSRLAKAKFSANWVPQLWIIFITYHSYQSSVPRKVALYGYSSIIIEWVKVSFSSWK